MRQHTLVFITCGFIVWQVGIATPSSAAAADLDSDPKGIHLTLRGPISIAGRAPISVDELPEGDYRLTAEGPGLPAVRGRFRRDALGLHLRSWAGPGALLTPAGLIHLERREQRGWIFLGGTVTAAGLAFPAHTSFRDAEDDIDRAADAYTRAASEDELDAASQDLLVATRERDDAKEIRNLWVGYAAVMWVSAGLESWLLTAQPFVASPGGSANVVIGMPRAGRWGAGLRSALVPGAGQRYMGRSYLGRSVRGNHQTIAVAVGAGAAIFAQENFLEARRHQARAQDDFNHAETEDELDRARHALRTAADDVDDKNFVRWAIVSVTGGIYVWNIVDAFLARSDEAESAFSWSVSPSGGGVLAAASWSLR